MELATFITLTTLLFWFFFLIKKRLSFIQNSILFMVIGIITKNYLTIMMLELGRVRMLEDHTLYVSLLLYRDFIIPLTILIFANAYLETSTSIQKLFCSLSALLFLVIIEGFLVYFNVIIFTDWSLLHEAVVNAIYLLIGLIFVKLILFLQKWESRQNESHL